MIRILFLIQSANSPEYIFQEERIRETWGKTILKGDYDGVELLFYRGGGDGTIDKHILKLQCHDGLNNTFEKTLKAIEFVKDKYDFIVRTNTSLWCNVPTIHKSLIKYDPYERIICAGNLVKNGASLNIPFLRGNFLILNRTLQEDIVNAQHIIRYNHIDDVSIAINLFYYYKKIGVDYIQTIRKIPNFGYDGPIESQILETICKSCFYIRVTDYQKKYHTNVLKAIDDSFDNTCKPPVFFPTKFNKIETCQGMLPFNY